MTANAELKESDSGKKYVSVGVACNQSDTDKEGKEQELTTYYSVYLFDRMAEIFSNLKKGDMIFASGKMKQRTYLSKGREPKVENKVFADEFHKVAFVETDQDKETE